MRLIEYDDQIGLMKQIDSYNLLKNQRIFSALPKESIVDSSKKKNRHPIVLVTNNEIVTTFFILQEKEGIETYSDNKHAILLRSFSTNSKYQGNGFAKKALQLLPSYIRSHFESINEIVLAVNSVNTVAITLYKKCGFIDTSRRIKTEYGSLIVFSQIIE